MINFPKILFLAATHGDEGFTLPLLKKLEGEFPKQLHWLVANEKALASGVRFVDSDLNRSAPGDLNSNQYEMRRAAELISLSSEYEFMIDLHGTISDSGIFVIVSNPTPQNMALATTLPISNVVIWSSKISNKFGPLTQFVNCGVGIECGPKSSESISNELQKIIREILTYGLNLKSTQRQNWFRVYGKIPNDGPHVKGSFRDFQLAALGKETFYPLLVGQYNDLICYKMERLNFSDLFGY